MNADEQTPNVYLRRARLALDLTQQGLADLFNAHYESAAAVDANYISKLERGRIRWPNKRYRATFRHILGAETDATLGFAPYHPAYSGRDLLDADARAGGAAPRRSSEVFGDLTSRRIGDPEIAKLHLTIGDLCLLDGRIGGDLLWRLAQTQLESVENAINGLNYTDEVGRELQRVAGELKTSIGWYSFDANKQNQAHRYFSDALNLAYMTGDHLLVARTLANMARQAIHCGKPREAVLFAQRGLDSTGRFVPKRVRALLAIREAQGWAALRMKKQCEDAIRLAHAAFDSSSDALPDWLSFFNEAELTCLEGMSRADLGQYRPATSLLERSAQLRSDGLWRNLGIGLIRLAQVATEHRELDRAAAVAKNAAAIGVEITSARMRGELLALKRQLDQHRDVGVVQDAMDCLEQAS